MIPTWLGIALGALTTLGLGAIRLPHWRRPLAWTAVTVGLWYLVMAALLQIAPNALRRSEFPLWVPPLAFSALAVWVLGHLIEWKLKRRFALITALLVAAGLTAFSFHSGRYLRRTLERDRMRAWSVYHYYLGAKYFGELSYFELYAATLAADDEFQTRTEQASGEERARLERTRDYEHIVQTRDMRTYEMIPRAQAVADFDRSVFTDERWEEFGDDTRQLRREAGRDTWPHVILDLGYNPSPAWNVLGTPVSNLIALSERGKWWIANSDLPVLLLMAAGTWWAFGLRVMAVGWLWFFTIHFNEGRMFGGFFQYEWLASLVLAHVLYRKRKPGWAGVALSWGAMTRVFPGFLSFPILAAAGLQLIGVRAPSSAFRAGLPRWRRISRARQRFLAGFCAACLGLLVASHFTGRGLDSWPEWVEKIGAHAGTHSTTSNQRVGLGRLVLHDWNGRRTWSTFPGGPEAKLAATAGRKRLWQLISVGLLLPALWRRRDEDSFGLMQFLVFAGTTLSRYYASIWMLWPSFGQSPRTGWRPSWPSVFGGAVLLLTAGSFHLPTDHTGRYFLVNYEAWFFFALLCLGWTAWDLLQNRRRRTAQGTEPAPAEDREGTHSGASGRA